MASIKEQIEELEKHFAFSLIDNNIIKTNKYTGETNIISLLF